MRIHVVSDVHGNVDDLKRVGDGADAVIVLGDLIDFVDYHNHERGILGRVFGKEKVSRFAELRRSNAGSEIGAYTRSLWESLPDPIGVVEEAVREQYAELFGAMTAPTYAIPGNVDAPRLWSEFVGGDVYPVDGRTVEIGGVRFGFVGGTLRPPGMTPNPNAAWVPYMRSEEEFNAVVEQLGPVDVLCTHLPPNIPELLYDVIAMRPERGSDALLERIATDRPQWALFGHVHQPLSRRVRAGRTECVNVGHFKRTGQPYVLRW